VSLEGRNKPPQRPKWYAEPHHNAKKVKTKKIDGPDSEFFSSL